MSHRRRRAGFTVVELVAVCVILVILAGVVIPMVGGAIQGTKRARALGDLRAYLEAVKMVRRDTGEWPRYTRTNPPDFYTWSVPLSWAPGLDPEAAEAGHNLQDRRFGLVGNLDATVNLDAHYENWHGPYMEKCPPGGAQGRDPWGTPYLYIAPRARPPTVSADAQLLNRVGLLMSCGQNKVQDTLPAHWAERRFGGDDMGIYFSE
ncbi:MAG: prepilin-type N-terminal cleavage/methylation domain-containing protein [Planctomycetes bacterium]|nr:prepilin-type N-terminal cleavage/methylation domain-containing protein [Planctomycetota bacterium]